MGFCLFNNACVAAYAALGSGAARIAVVDFDVHHGNGTQDILWTEPRALYVSLHQSPLYPGTGRASETGGGEYGGTILNLPLPPGTGDREYLRLVDERVLPALVEHRPDLIIVSAGYDCLGGDPLAGLELTAGGVKRVAEALVAVAGGLCGGRLLVTLEGGYALDGLVEGVAGTLEALL
jgi:acetoin utilization deacetylase AcuC-like enzyme